MTNLKTRVSAALKALISGKMIILKDDDHRENEGDLVFAAEFATPEAINFCLREARGVICVSLAKHYIEKFQLDDQPKRNTLKTSANFTISVDAVNDITTGVSASDRSITIKTLIAENSTPKDISTPGHIFPLASEEDGVLERRGHTEGSIDLMQLANLKSAAVICEILNDDGTMARGDDLDAYSNKHNLPILTIEDIRQYRLLTETTVNLQTETIIPTERFGDIQATTFSLSPEEQTVIALHKPDIKLSNKLPIRIHSSCFTGDILSSLRCDCGSQLALAMEHILKNDGLLIYLPQEGRNIGLANKLKAYELQDSGMDTVEANLALGLPIDSRSYEAVASLLEHFKIDHVSLLTNNPEKINSLVDLGITVEERIPLITKSNVHNEHYLKTKKNELHHMLGEDKK